MTSETHFKLYMHQYVFYSNHLVQVREASRKPLTGWQAIPGVWRTQSLEADSSLERVQMCEAYRNCCLCWLRRREDNGGSNLHFKSLRDKRAKCFLWARTDAKESSRTWVTIKRPSGHPPELGDSDRKNQNQGQSEGTPPLPGNNAIKIYLICHSEGYKVIWPLY